MQEEIELGRRRAVVQGTHAAMLTPAQLGSMTMRIARSWISSAAGGMDAHRHHARRRYRHTRLASFHSTIAQAPAVAAWSTRAIRVAKPTKRLSVLPPPHSLAAIGAGLRLAKRPAQCLFAQRVDGRRRVRGTLARPRSGWPGLGVMAMVGHHLAERRGQFDIDMALCCLHPVELDGERSRAGRPSGNWPSGGPPGRPHRRGRRRRWRHWCWSAGAAGEDGGGAGVEEPVRGAIASDASNGQDVS